MHLRLPLLVFGGPYSNARAVTALRAQAKVLGIDAMHTICTGDSSPIGRARIGRPRRNHLGALSGFAANTETMGRGSPMVTAVSTATRASAFPSADSACKTRLQIRSSVPMLIEMTVWGARNSKDTTVDRELLRRFDRDREQLIADLQAKVRRDGGLE